MQLPLQLGHMLAQAVPRPGLEDHRGQISPSSHQGATSPDEALVVDAKPRQEHLVVHRTEKG
jgi:hypothetical protein